MGIEFGVGFGWTIAYAADEKGRRVEVREGPSRRSLLGDTELLELLAKMKRQDESVEEYILRMARKG